VSEPTPGWPALGAPGAEGAGVIVEPPGSGEDDGGGTVGDVPAGAGDVELPPLLEPPPYVFNWTAPTETAKARAAIKVFLNIRSSRNGRGDNRRRKRALHGRAKS